MKNIDNQGIAQFGQSAGLGHQRSAGSNPATLTTKICSKCQKEKPMNEFRWRNRTKGYRSCWCKSCFSLYEKEKWKDQTDNRRNKHRQQQLSRRSRNINHIWKYLSGKCCVECGITNLIVLEFDHIEPNDKCGNISDLARDGYSIKNLQREMEKCQVLCANCHRIKTAKERGWDKTI